MGRKLARTLQLGILFSVVLFGYTVFSDQEFAKWQTNFRYYAQQHGIKDATLDTAFRGLLIDKKVLKLDTYQPEFSRPVWEYMDSAVSPERVEQGRYVLKQYAPLLKRISDIYHVDIEYIVAIWGMESSYGQQLGNYSAIRSLATLAYQGREERRNFWRTQLVAALRILQSGDMPSNNLRGSWAGALGHTQFIPSTFEEFAVDFDGDGKRDLRASIPDALASTANYLAQSGWQQGQPWGTEVVLPVTFDWMETEPANWQSLNYWSAQGMYRVDGTALEDSPTLRAAVIIPAGYRGPAFLTYPNFNVLLKYNNAISYALAAGYLAERLKGGLEVQAAWPRNEEPLSRLEKAELQERLSAVGYSTDGVDGTIGPNTRAALRRWQADTGFPADGYATLEHLKLLREQTALPRMLEAGS
ncbi:lytic murein transglycosylase [uncultured Thiothrix sp.]|mgnify:FL=1|uniref:lytic murein transglycosylase n=1 Tax=uncultured Thiothrix sp. TaxID=223185 RepID=UPI002614310A|nr:lytic murein transglycosylase [uncultured Thiothrix sp.]HMT92773.1 lytic murein transglycosylase [Thiolinea sp.]